MAAKNSLGKTTKAVNTEVKAPIPVNENLSVEATSHQNEIEVLKKQNEENAKANAALQEQLSQIMSLLSSKSTEVDSADKEEKPVLPKPVFGFSENMVDTPEMPASNKMVQLVSLCYGSLNLSTGEQQPCKLKFRKFGEIKPVLYSDLMDIVNYHRSFAEKGRFYILDRAAVYYLGLDDFYKSIATKDIIENIMDYPEVDITSIINNMVDGQKDVLANIIRDKAYRSKKPDLNKLELIGKLCGHPEILTELQEMGENKHLEEKVKK